MTVSRGTPAGAAYLDLRNKARAGMRPFAELLALHVLDAFLARLSISPQRDRLVLKGGVLLAAFDLRRPTRDVDLMADDLDNDAENVLGVVRVSRSYRSQTASCSTLRMQRLRLSVTTMSTPASASA